MDFINFLVIPALVSGSVYALVATGFNVVERTTRVLNFAHGELIVWAPMAALVSYTILDWPAWVALVAAVVVPVALVLVEEVVAIRPFIGQPGQYPWILSTLGVSLILQQAAFAPFEGQVQSFPIALPRQPLEVAGARLSPQGLLVIVAAVVVLIALTWLYDRTDLGRMLTAVAEDADGARMIGISPTRMSRIALMISALVAAVTGLVVAPIFLVEPHTGFGLVFIGFVAAAIGGLANITGGYIGAYVVGFVIQATAYHLSAVWVNAVVFGCFLLFYLVRPTGLFSGTTLREV
ncbi:branched-chain amino acid ABC transporter permease [Euzebya sp.]|uniref:branched-chain amino acid ABC transporter permease n=1 Tax=Euzebya sp. TaxID=1971409 RepID=UPI003518C04F